MADEASDTISGGIRNFLGALGFISALIGAEVLRESGPNWVGVTLIAAGLPIYLSPVAWKAARRWIKYEKAAAQSPLEYLHNKDSELGSAIRDMGWRSAWARWYAAQHLVNSEKPITEGDLLHIASLNVRQNLIDETLRFAGGRPAAWNTKSFLGRIGAHQRFISYKTR
jgi:hypothetical protein